MLTEKNTTSEIHPIETLNLKAKQWRLTLRDKKFSEFLDEEDPLSKFRQKFHYPIKKHLYNGKFTYYFSLFIYYNYLFLLIRIYEKKSVKFSKTPSCYTG